MTLLTDHLPLLAGAPDGIKKLRELILELAVRGKLVAQDPSDEPADVLLARLALKAPRANDAEKKPIQQEFQSIDEKQKTFEIPDSWIWIRFGQVAQHNSGKTLDSGRNSGALRDYITTSNLYWGYFKLENVRQMLIREDELERCTARKGDLLICEGGEAGRAAVWELDSEVCFQNHIHRARLRGDLVPRFFYRLFERLNATGEVGQYRKGVGISNMSGKSLASIIFPLPPVAEQHRIVAKVDELMALCDTLESQQADAESAHAQLVKTLLDSLSQASDAGDFAASWHRLSEHFDTLFTTEASIDALKQTVLQLAVMGRLVPQDPADEPACELLTSIAKEKARLVAEGRLKQAKLSVKTPEREKFDLPTGWKWVGTDEITLLITDGTHHTPTYISAGVPFISVKDIDGTTVSFDHCKYISQEEYIAINARCNPEQGDVLLCRIGTLGRPTIVDTAVPFSLFVSVGLLKLPKTVDISRYLQFALSSPLMYRQYDEIKAGGSHTNKLNLGDIPRLRIPLPPLAEQHRIVAKVDQLMALGDQLKTRIRKSRDLNQQLASTLVERAVA